MRGARVARWIGVSLTLLSLAAPAWAQEEYKITDNDRLFRNYNYETATVQPGQFRLEVRGMILHDDTNNRPVVAPLSGTTGFQTFQRFSPQLIIRGFPAGDSDRLERRDDLVEVSGGTLDLVGSYGIFKNAEVGFDVQGILQGLSFANTDAILATPANMVPEAEKRSILTVNENNNDFGDTSLYGKYKFPVTEKLDIGGGVELRAPTGQEKKRLGTGEWGVLPFAGFRYTGGRWAVGGTGGYQFNMESVQNVGYWSAYALGRLNRNYAFRVELTGRHFDYPHQNNPVSMTCQVTAGGHVCDLQGIAPTTLDDVTVMPGIDYNYSKNITIRPVGLAGITNEAMDWGLGIGVSYIF